MKQSEDEIGRGTTKQVGYTFVSNVMDTFTIGEVDANKIMEVSTNLYVQGPVTQTANMVTSGDATITVYDEKDDVVEDVSRRLNLMFSQPKCNLTACISSSLKDRMIWGMSIYNQYWVRESGELVCKELTRLHPYSFRTAPVGASNTRVYGQVLKGVYYDMEDKTIHYCQKSKMSASPEELDPESLFVVKDSYSDYPDGQSLFHSLVPIILFLNYAWNTLGQQMYRTGAPIMFIKITDPKGERTINGEYQESDVAYAEKIIATAGKDTSYVLRQNMEIINFDVTEGSLAIEGINKANETIRDFLSPVGMLGRDGTLIAGNTDASLRLVNNNIEGWSRFLESEFRVLPNRYLEYNGYPEGWHAEVTVPHNTMEDRSIKLQMARLGFDTKALSINEVREFLGAEGVGEDELTKMKEEWDSIATSVSQMPIGSFMSMIANTSQTPAPNRQSYKKRNEIAKEAESNVDESLYDLERSVMKIVSKAAGMKKSHTTGENDGHGN